MQQLEGFVVDNSPDPFVIACSNCPWDLDPAFIRRFSRRIFIDMPTPEDTEKILQNKLENVAMSTEFGPDVWAKIVNMAKGRNLKMFQTKKMTPFLGGTKFGP